MKHLLLFFRRMLKGTLTLLLCLPFLALAQPTQEEIQQSIDDGLSWLVAQQHADGYWNAYYSNYEAGTGLALYKLCERAYELGYESPFDPGYAYYQNVIDGFNWLFKQLEIVDINVQDHTSWATGTMDDPDVNGNGTGVCTRFNLSYETYTTGILLTAIAASGTPDRIVSDATSAVDGWTYGDIAQDMVDFLAWGQVEGTDGWGNAKEGGWDYYHVNNGAGGSSWKGDQSNSGYAVLGLAEAQAFGATIPDWVKTALSVWVDYVQDDMDDPAQPNDGGSWYSYPGDGIGINTLKTGNLLTEMALCGDTPETQRVMDAVAYLVNHWYDATGANAPPGWNGTPANYQAMFCIMKGLVFIGIDMIDGINWFDDIATAIVAQQYLPDPPDANYGAWMNSDGRGEPVIITEWALLTLEKIAPPPPVVMVDFDVHPTSWPNPINTKSKGLTPTAILGTEDFDVTTIDPATLYLDLPEGMVYPVNWAYEDVTMPAGNAWECNDTEMGPDGYMDLTVKFNTQELIAALGEINDGDELIIVIKGNLMDDGQAIEGDDCILIIKKGTKDAVAQLPSGYDLSQNYPNPFMGSTRIGFALPQDSHVTLQIFDLLGNEVTTLTEDFYPAGEHTLMLDASTLESGTYLYRLSTDKFNETKRMLLIK